MDDKEETIMYWTEEYSKLRKKLQYYQGLLAVLAIIMMVIGIIFLKDYLKVMGGAY